MKSIILLFCIFIISNNNVFSQLNIEVSSALKIPTAYGPEDIVLDVNDPRNPRIIISCTHYKGKKRIDGGIWFLPLNEEDAVPQKFTLDGYEPAFLRPHGISIQGNLLYVISHARKQLGERIIVFKINGNELLFKKLYSGKSDPVIKNINDLYATPAGDIYFSNPAPLFKTFFKRKQGYVGRIKKGSDKATVFIDKLVFPNGVFVEGNTIYITDSTLDQLFSYKLSKKGKLLPDRKSLAKIKTGDNISKFENSLLIANHPNKFKFGMHAAFKTKSPSSVYQYDLNTGTAYQIFKDNGKLISASSTALVYDGYLYVSQVMKNFILRIKTNEIDRK